MKQCRHAAGIEVRFFGLLIIYDIFENFDWIHPADFSFMFFSCASNEFQGYRIYTMPWNDTGKRNFLATSLTGCEACTHQTFIVEVY